MEAIAVLVVFLVISIFVVTRVVKNLISIAGPNEVLVFSGPTVQEMGEVRGYRTVRGGSRIRVPLMEKVSRLDLTNMIIEVNVTGAYSAGGIPLNVQAVANVKIGGDGQVLHNALQRLLGKPRAEVMKIAKETLEGNLRGVLATLTPEQVNEDKTAFAHSLLEEAEHDLSILGIMLDTLAIQNVTDDQGYLQAIGRKQSADLQRRARMAEAAARATALITQASNSEQTATAQINAQTQVSRAEAERRIIDAQTRRGAVVAEQEAEVAALVARAEAERNVQLARIEMTSRQLAAEVIEPARAQRDSMIAEAEGAAARIIEDARARAEGLRRLAEVWAEEGDDAKQVLMMQKLDEIVIMMTSMIHNVKVKNLTLLDVPESQQANSPSVGVTRAVEELRATTGVDLADVASKLGRAVTGR